MLLLHYTGMPTAADALARLTSTGSDVSCHYLVDVDGRVVQLVPEIARAWHAGLSVWEDETDTNSRSIGVELVNPGHDGGYPDFPPAQIEAVTALCSDIVGRHGIAPMRVLGHSDVAPVRKRDPGEKFPWARLAATGVGHFVPPRLDMAGTTLAQGDHGAAVEELQSLFALYGYGIEITGNFDAPTSCVVAAFQRHFHPKRIDGIADAATVLTLRDLLASLPRSG